jgi:hypothetical protein
MSAENLYVAPGRNDVAMQGTLLKSGFARRPQLASRMFSSFIAGQPSVLVVRGERTEFGNNTISWLSESVRTMAMRVNVQQAATKNLISDVEVSNMALRLTNENPNVNLTWDIWRGVMSVKESYPLNTNRWEASPRESRAG